MSEFRLQFGEFDVSARIDQAAQARATLVFAHGAGAGMSHTTLNSICEAVNSIGLTCLRFNFPYMEAGKNRTDNQEVACMAIAAAFAHAQVHCTAPIYLGGHSFGGRMASHAVVDLELDVRGLIFGSFPLHTAKKINLDRGSHLGDVPCPMLFLSGTRDGMARSDLMEQLVAQTGSELRWLDTADHGYKVLKRTRQRKDDVFAEMAEHIDKFLVATMN